MTFPQERHLLAMLALAPALFFSSCTKKQPAAADSSSPKKASLAFASAMVSGDIGGMRAASVGTNSHVFAFYVGLAEAVTAEHKFKTAIVAKFGAACILPPDIEAIGKLNPMPPDYDKLTEKIDGDTASLVDASGHGGLKFRKVEGQWKVDFDAVDAALPQGGAEQLAKQQQIFEETKKAFDAVTAKIVGGSYNDCVTAVNDVMLPHP